MTNKKKHIKHCVIGDTQCKSGVDLAYLRAVGLFLLDKKPDVIILIGDHFDLPSLSSYDKGKRVAQGRTLQEDIAAGQIGLDVLMAPIKEYNIKRKANHKKLYSPRWVYCLGNHEERADRLANEMPELHGTVGSNLLGIEERGWEVVPFLQPIAIEGIQYVHYVANPFSGKPVGGSAANILKHTGKSFAMGHRQTLDIHMRPILGGGHQLGLIVGACYLHDEPYKGPQGNNHFRGVVMLHEVSDGYALPMPVSLQYMMERYL